MTRVGVLLALGWTKSFLSVVVASEVCLLPASISLEVDSSNLESINFGWQWRSLTPISKPCCLALRKRSPIATSAQSTRSFQAFRSRILGEFMFKRLQHLLRRTDPLGWLLCPISWSRIRVTFGSCFLTYLKFLVKNWGLRGSSFCTNT